MSHFEAYFFGIVSLVAIVAGSIKLLGSERGTALAIIVIGAVFLHVVFMYAVKEDDR